MTKIEKILGYMKDSVLPANRDLTASEACQLKAMATQETDENGVEMKKSTSSDEAVLDAIEMAYRYGFWMGWSYCEAENDIRDEDA